jgi:hypothetical protein
MSARTRLDQIRIEPPDAVAGCEDCLAHGRPLGAPARVPDPPPRRLLRLVAQPPRDVARPRHRHPIIRSAEPGEGWCYEDEVAFALRA